MIRPLRKQVELLFNTRYGEQGAGRPRPGPSIPAAPCAGAEGHPGRLRHCQKTLLLECCTPASAVNTLTLMSASVLMDTLTQGPQKDTYVARTFLLKRPGEKVERQERKLFFIKCLWFARHWLSASHKFSHPVSQNPCDLTPVLQIRKMRPGEVSETPLVSGSTWPGPQILSSSQDMLLGTQSFGVLCSVGGPSGGTF